MKRKNKGSILAGLLALQFVMQTAGVQVTAFAEDAVLPTETAADTTEAATTAESTAAPTEVTVAATETTEVTTEAATEATTEAATTASTEATTAPAETTAPTEATAVAISTDVAPTAEASDGVTLTNAVTVPNEIKEGAVVSIGGTLNSANGKAITKVRLEILTKAGSVLYYGEAAPNTTTYDLKKLDEKLLFNKLTGGDYIYRISATNSAGASYNQDVPFKVLAANELDYLKLEGTLTNIPATLKPGTPVTVSGTVKSGQTSITSVSIKITDQNGKEWCPNKVVPGKTEYNLKGLDNIITFDKLPVGTYSFKVIASNKANTDKVLQEVTFNVGSGSVVTQDTITLVNATALPDTMVAGSNYSVRGNVTSASSNLKSLFVGVYNSAGQVVSGRTIALNTQSYDLVNMDTYVPFNTLSAGNYLFAIIASNNTKNNEVLFTKSFTVTGTSPVVTTDEITLTGATEVPNTVNAGSTLSIHGNVKSESSNLKTLTVAVYDLNGNFKTGGTINPAAKDSDLYYLDRYLNFNTLAAGSYHYYVMASNDKYSNKVLAHKQFTVAGTAVADTISISGFLALPSSFPQKTAQTLKGTVTSGSSNLTTLFVGFYNNLGQVVTGRTINPASTSCDLVSKMSQYLDYTKLTAGDYTFAVIASNATTSNQVLVNQKVKVTASTAASLSITGNTAIPATMVQGSKQKVSGIVNSDSTMTSLFVGIYNAAGQLESGRTINPNATSFDISKLDSYVRFDTLKAGTYTYAVIASNATNTNYSIIKQTITVTANNAADKLTLTNGSVIPDKIAVGKAVTVSGVVTSATSNITALTVGVYKGQELVTGRSINPNAKSYNLSNLDKYVLFNTLKDGEYTYAVIATNASFTNETLYAKKFIVGNGGVTDSITMANGTTVPNPLTKGKSVSVKGTITSSAPLTSVTVAICDANGAAVYSQTVTPNAKTYTISSAIDNAMYFNRLAAGSYSYRVIVSTANTSNYALVNQAFTVK